MKTIKDLCKKVKFEDIQRALNYHYPEDKNNYLSVYDKILACEVQEIKDEEISIRAYGNHNIPDDQLVFYDDEDDHYDVSIYKISEKMIYSASFRDWNELFNTPIYKETLKHNTPEEILAHFIWEITFYGNQEETKEVCADVMGRMEEAKAIELKERN